MSTLFTNPTHFFYITYLIVESNLKSWIFHFSFSEVASIINIPLLQGLKISIQISTTLVMMSYSVYGIPYCRLPIGVVLQRKRHVGDSLWYDYCISCCLLLFCTSLLQSRHYLSLSGTRFSSTNIAVYIILINVYIVLSNDINIIVPKVINGKRGLAQNFSLVLITLTPMAMWIQYGTWSHQKASTRLPIFQILMWSSLSYLPK